MDAQNAFRKSSFVTPVAEDVPLGGHAAAKWQFVDQETLHEGCPEDRSTYSTDSRRSPWCRTLAPEVNTEPNLLTARESTLLRSTFVARIGQTRWTASLSSSTFEDGLLEDLSVYLVNSKVVGMCFLAPLLSPSSICKHI